MESTNQTYVIQQIKHLISRDNLVEACDLFEPTFLEKKALGIKGRLQDLENRNQRGILEMNEYNVSKNIIRDNLLNLVVQLENGETELIKKNQQMLTRVVGVLILLGILITIWWPNLVFWSLSNNSPIKIIGENIVIEDEKVNFNFIIQNIDKSLNAPIHDVLIKIIILKDTNSVNYNKKKVNLGLVSIQGNEKTNLTKLQPITTSLLSNSEVMFGLEPSESEAFKFSIIPPKHEHSIHLVFTLSVKYSDSKAQEREIYANNIYSILSNNLEGFNSLHTQSLSQASLSKLKREFPTYFNNFE